MLFALIFYRPASHQLYTRPRNLPHPNCADRTWHHASAPIKDSSELRDRHLIVVAGFVVRPARRYEYLRHIHGSPRLEPLGLSVVALNYALVTPSRYFHHTSSSSLSSSSTISACPLLSTFEAAPPGLKSMKRPQNKSLRRAEPQAKAPPIGPELPSDITRPK
jgi:hypothetical protein